MNEHKYRVFYSLTKDLKIIKKKFYHSILYIHLSQTYLKKGDFLHNFSTVQDFLLEEGDNNHDRKRLFWHFKNISTLFPNNCLWMYCKKYLHTKRTIFIFYITLMDKHLFWAVHRKCSAMFKKNLNKHTYTIHSEALAGTVVRGSNIKEDLELKKLLHSKKMKKNTKSSSMV